MNRTLFLLAALLLSLTLPACRRSLPVPAVESEQYRELCSAFFLGLAALQSGEDVNARKGLTRATEIAPGEPAAWVNLGLLQARQQEDDAAYESFQKANALDPRNSRIETFLGTVENRRGNLSAALTHFRRAVDLDSGNLRAMYTLAVEIEREQTDSSVKEALALLDRILKVQPQNEPVHLDVIRLAAKLNDAARVKQSVHSLANRASAWPPPAREIFARLQQSAAADDLREAAIQSQFLRNTLVRELGFRRSMEEIRAPGNSIGEPFRTFLKLPSPASEPSAADKDLRFEWQALSEENAVWAGAIHLDEEGAAAVLWAEAAAVHVRNGPALALPRGRTRANPGPHSITAADLNYDFKPDLVFATASGLRIYEQTNSRQFTDVTAKTRLPAEILQGAYTGAWPLDFDLDGDLDIVLGTPQGEPIVIRNNGDGSFAPVRPFRGTNGLIGMATGDIDGDGVPDAAVIDAANKLFVFRNERLGVYTHRPAPRQIADGNHAVAAGDVNSDGLIDFVLLRQNGAIVRLSDRDYGKAWETAEMARVSPVPNDATPLLADLDNNGGIDVVAGDQVVLSERSGFSPLSARLPCQCQSLADLNQDGRLDLLGLAAGKPVQLTSHGAKKYKWQVIRTKAATVMGDQRMNSFGIGGEIEIRSGLLTQKQMIQSPVLHFGLGDHPTVDFARIVWPNGIIQAEFGLQPEQSVLAHQRLKGSCPFLFTWDGRQMRFLKDVAPMSAPIGAHRDAHTLESVAQTQQWFKIAGDQLAPKDGYYDVRLTNEYWETHYTDFYSLMTVDHPRGTHIFVDERVADPPAPLKIYVTEQSQSFARVTDDQGSDAGPAVQAVDAHYLDGFGVGQYQGLTRDHWVELELPEHAPRTGQLYLIADGFIHPWDDTITMARSQRTDIRPEDLRIEVADRSGKWRIAKDRLGMPAGRLKTMVLDISRIFREGDARKLRLRTNMEVYWDRLAWAVGLPAERAKTHPAKLAHGELRYRGFSLITQAGPSAPELAHYDNLVSTGERWRSLEGYYTRYGDVKPLLEGIDDRFVIASSGDEFRLRFEAVPSAPDGSVRDYIFIGDGWIKEGDYNFRLSKTVLPLPHRGMKSYNLPLTPLERDRTYRRNAADWQHFHTRYLSPDTVARALWR